MDDRQALERARKDVKQLDERTPLPTVVIVVVVENDNDSVNA
jgi:hypothetical protein